MTTVPVAAVANEFLDLAEQDQSPIDQMKLQKLLFYAQAWYLAMHDDILFPEDINAWEWGPVVSTIYYQTIGLGRNPVTKKMRHLVSTNGDNAVDKTLNATWKIPSLDETDAEIKNHIKETWEVHKGFTGIQLSNSTHAEGEPWAIVKEKYGGDLYIKPTIPVDLIKTVFQNKAEQQQGDN